MPRCLNRILRFALRPRTLRLLPKLLLSIPSRRSAGRSWKGSHALDSAEKLPWARVILDDHSCIGERLSNVIPDDIMRLHLRNLGILEE